MERSERRDAAADRPGVMILSRRKRLSLEAPLMQVVATAGITGISVRIAAIMASQHSQGVGDRSGRVGRAGRRAVVLAAVVSAGRAKRYG